MARAREADKYSMKSRVILVAALLMTGYIGVTVRLVYLQVINQNRLERKAVRQQHEVVELPPRRGSIYDRTGRELAVSIDADSMYGVPASIEDPKGIAKRLAPIVGMRERDIEDKLTGEKKFIWLARKVEPGIEDRVNAELKSAGKPNRSIGWLSDSRRYYPKKELAGHILGFTGMDNRGLEGIESTYESYIGGVAGKAVTERDGAGREVLSVEEGHNPPQPGNDLVLTIDEKVQYVVEKELDNIMSKYSAVSATAIVMDPNTGAIIALANRPAFNPNSYKDYPTANWRDKAVTDIYEPGSTFKIVTAAAAFEERVVKPTDIIEIGNGEISIGDRTIHDSHNDASRLSFAEVIQKSSNVGTIRVALKLGPERLYSYAKAFGFGSKTGVDLPGETDGKLRDVRSWSAISIASVAIGQEVGVTPVQMLSAMNTIANGGWFVRPYIVSQVRSGDGTVVRQARTEKVRRVVSPATAAKLRDILCKVVEEGGTAVEANVRGYQVAGKTGTAQKYDPAIHKYSKSKYCSSFVGFVPAEDPKISCIVVVNEPHGQYYGGLVAAPAFKSIVEKTLTYMRVPTRLPEQTILVEKR
ncbi:MAG TPA: penicillin-binding protein 2 [Nitrospirota bacterium]